MPDHRYMAATGQSAILMAARLSWFIFFIQLQPSKADDHNWKQKYHPQQSVLILYNSNTKLQKREHTSPPTHKYGMWNKLTIFTHVIFSLAYFSHSSFQAFLEGFLPIFLDLQFCIFASLHSNPFVLQKLAACNFFHPSGMSDFRCYHQKVRPILQC